MTASELKLFIHESVEYIEDEHFLEALRIIIEAKIQNGSEPVLSDWQKKRLEESRQQIKDGKFYSNDEVNQMVDKWFEGK